MAATTMTPPTCRYSAPPAAPPRSRSQLAQAFRALDAALVRIRQARAERLELLHRVMHGELLSVREASQFLLGLRMESTSTREV